MMETKVIGNKIAKALYPGLHYLHDSDHVLRIDGTWFETERVANLVGKFGSSCEELL